MESKAEIRKEMRELRKNMELSSAVEKSRNICRRLLENDHLRDANEVFVYSAVGNEVQMWEVVLWAWQMGKKVAFPRNTGETMEFFEIAGYDEVTKGGGPNGAGKKEKVTRMIPTEHTVICVPGVAFSRKGDRIGMGKAFYDRYLARYPQVHTIGVCYEQQICEPWETEEHDIPVDEIVTEKGEFLTHARDGR